MVERHQVMIDGTLGGSGQERWCVGMHFRAGPEGRVSDPGELQEWAEAIAGWLSTATLPGLKNLLSSSGRITQVRAYYYNDTGPAQAVGTAILGTPISGTGTAARPPQCAHVFTLVTGLAGRRYRGRFYWPALAGAFDGTTLKGAPPGTAAAEAALILGTLGTLAASTGVLDPVVYSKVADEVTQVTAVRVGDVIDTQRRRRDNLVEIYTTAGI